MPHDQGSGGTEADHSTRGDRELAYTRPFHAIDSGNPVQPRAVTSADGYTRTTQRSLGPVRSPSVPVRSRDAPVAGGGPADTLRDHHRRQPRCRRSDPADLAAIYWDMYTGRDRIETVHPALTTG
nr:hypothetical protein Ade03nite_93310 [Actinoplanes derwentensis]